ncbi:MAG: hypothetical protein DI565_13825 [Ancylobacter novellus]|uniref:Uncharacterized protein n=1 Tax=Ancylobacter novellus TaxID=921 RepID=A0A2W5K8W4_ANCNO|nr:MAG: hypothetical protein DI565_13825 [Ancylobacter novellus]
MNDVSDRLSGYPWVIVRIACVQCPRRGAYRLARLAARLGSEASLEEVVLDVSRDCPYRSETPRRRERKYVPNCKAYLPDLAGPKLPPDLPPGLARLRVIKGGANDKPKDAAE